MTTVPAAHVAILGAGALGSLIGAAAVGGGARVTLIARPAQASAINGDGIVVRGASGPRTVPSGPRLMAATESTAVSGHVDYLLITVTGRSTRQALESARPLLDRVGAFGSFQNGIEHDDILSEMCGPGRVIGAMTMEGAALIGPGVVDHLLSASTYLGELDGTSTTRIAALAGLLSAGGLPTFAVRDIRAAKWTKFVQSCAASGLCAATGLGYASATLTESGSALYAAMIREGVAVMRANGFEPGDYFPATAKVREVADLPSEDAMRLVRQVAADLIKLGYTGTTSLARDLAAGRPTEVDALLGAMHRCGVRSEVPTPTLDAIGGVVGAIEEGTMRHPTAGWGVDRFDDGRRQALQPHSS